MEQDIAYWRFIETEDVELAVSAQKGFKSGVLGVGRLHSIEGMLSGVFGCSRLLTMTAGQSTPSNGI